MAKPRDSLDAYIHDVSADSELYDLGAGLVITIAKRFIRPGIDLMDLIQEGNIAMLRASKKFDPNNGVPFSGYVGLAIKWACVTHIMESQLIRIPRAAQGHINYIRKHGCIPEHYVNRYSMNYLRTVAWYAIFRPLAYAVGDPDEETIDNLDDMSSATDSRDKIFTFLQQWKGRNPELKEKHILSKTEQTILERHAASKRGVSRRAPRGFIKSIQDEFSLTRTQVKWILLKGSRWIEGRRFYEDVV